MAKESKERALLLLEKVRKHGKIKTGINEVTKAAERGVAKFVYVAEDVTPAEIVAHIPMLCKEKKIPHTTIPTKKELGERAGIGVPASAVAIVEAGEEAKKDLEVLVKNQEKGE